LIRDSTVFSAFLETVRKFVVSEAVPIEAEIERRDEVPEHLVQRMRELGYFGWSIPEEYGGSGMTVEELVLAAIEFSQCSPAIRARVGTNTGIGSGVIVNDGTEVQKARFLPLLTSGEMTGSFALTEPNAGSDATAIRTSAVRQGDKYILNGHKRFITNAPIADLFTVFARTDPESRGAKGISAFLVERGTEGLRTGPAYQKMGQAGSPVGDVYLEDCVVSEDMLVGGLEGLGFEAAMKTLVRQRIHLSALCVGPAIRLLRDAVDHARSREQFGKPISEFQLVQGMLADSQTDIFAARSMVLESAQRCDAGRDVRLEASMCKYFASEMCGRVADRAVQILGGYGYLAGTAVERFYRDVRLFRLYEGTSQMHQLTIAKLVIRNAESDGWGAH